MACVNSTQYFEDPSRIADQFAMAPARPVPALPKKSFWHTRMLVIVRCLRKMRSNKMNSTGGLMYKALKLIAAYVRANRHLVERNFEELDCAGCETLHPVTATPPNTISTRRAMPDGSKSPSINNHS
eukprot:440301-Pleurochrysis_carterae.AAC.2